MQGDKINLQNTQQKHTTHSQTPPQVESQLHNLQELLAVISVAYSDNSYPVDWQRQDQKVGDDVRDGKGLEHGRALVAIRQQILERRPQSPELSAASEQNGEEEAKCPNVHHTDQGPREPVEGVAGEDGAVEV